MKKIIALLLVFIIVFSIAFQCTTTSYAIAGIDDVVVLGVCLDLLALGISIYSVQEFCKSDAFHDFCIDIGNHVESGISAIKRSGKLFVATSKLAWQDICNWVKSKFKGGELNKSIEFDTTVSSTPSDITLTNGSTVPYAEFMENPAFIYRLNGAIKAIWVDGANAGISRSSNSITLRCTGSGRCGRMDLVNGSWVEGWTRNMTYGYPYMGVNGSYYNLDFSGLGVNTASESFYLYRTIQVTNTSGSEVISSPPHQIPDEEETPGTSAIIASSDAIYYPGSVDAPAETIEDGEMILIECPQSLVVDADTDNPTVTTDLDAIGNQIAITTPSNVKPYVLTNPVPGVSSGSGVISNPAVDTPADIITDTPVGEMQGTGSIETDIEIANKFRLPKSFLEGFPFSIPYSVYVGIQTLVSDPQVPTFKIPFSIPRLGISENVEIDLTQWNPVARLCRALLSLVWVAGLAMACSKFLKR